MNTQAYFEDIAVHIEQELQKAQQTIVIAVAWFTDASLFRILCTKARQGVAIQLMIIDDEINNASSIDYDLLISAGGKVWKIISDENTLMHNKFCVIDGKTVINGSYNWTNKAKQNHESITVIEDYAIALQFIDEFNYLKKRYFGESAESATMDFGQLYIRLETLKNVILLEDSEDIDFQLRKIKKMLVPSNDNTFTNIYEIIASIEQKRYGDAVVSINSFVNKFKSLAVYIDSEITAIRLEIKMLGLQISSLEDEKNEIEKMLYAFNIQYNKELGEITKQILRIKKERLKEAAGKDTSKKKEAEDAEAEYQKFNQSYEDSKSKKINPLTLEQQAEIKQKFRQASKLCHPDVVNEAQSEQAKTIFQRLKTAYEENDLQAVSEILTNLEKGIFIDKATDINEKQKLAITISQLRHSRDILEQELVALKQSETYQTIIGIANWDKYFAEQKAKLKKILEELEKESAEL